MTSKRATLATALYLGVVFLSGVLVGGFAYRLYMVRTVLSGTETATRRPRDPEEYRRKYLQEMTTRLKLAPEQVSSLKQIMDETRQRYRDVHEKDRPILKGIEQDHMQRVRAMLSEPQQLEYDRMRAEREKRRQQEQQKQK